MTIACLPLFSMLCLFSSAVCLLPRYGAGVLLNMFNAADFIIKGEFKTWQDAKKARVVGIISKPSPSRLAAALSPRLPAPADPPSTPRRRARRSRGR